MIKYILKRLGISLIVLLGVSVTIFTLIHKQPGNPYENMIDGDSDPAFAAKRMAEMGYNDPISVQYFKWVKESLTGNLGYSIRFKTPVKDMILLRFKNTLLLSGTAFFSSAVVAVVLGVISASNRGGKLDSFITSISFVGISLPTFFFGLLLIKFLSYDINLLPPSGLETVGVRYEGFHKFIDMAKHMALPLLVLTFTQSASLLRYTRSSVAEVLQMDFIKTARAKGLTKNKTVWIHGASNSLITIITILCMQLPSLISGTVITETIFVWPGVGTLIYDSVLHKDYPVIMGVPMVMAVFIVLMNIISDLLYAVVNPRIRMNLL